MPHIDYFFSTVSPFTYLAAHGLEALAAKHGATVTYKPVDIVALFGRTGGTPPKDRHESRKAYRLQDLRRAGVKAGIPLNLQPKYWPTNPAPSSYAVIAAQASMARGVTGDLGGLVHGFLRACWAEEKDISLDDVVRAILSEHGFDADLADKRLLLGAETYANNLEDAVNRGVFGAPFYITDTDERFWGHDRLNDLDLHLSGKL